MTEYRERGRLNRQLARLLVKAHRARKRVPEERVSLFTRLLRLWREA